MCDLCPLDFLWPYNRLQEIQDIMGRSGDVDVVNQINGLIKMTRELCWQMVIVTGKFERHWHNAKTGHHVLGEVKVGDICMVASGVNTNYSRFGRLEKLLRPMTVLIRLGGKSVKCSKITLLPVFHPVVGCSPAAVDPTDGSARGGKL